MNIVIISTSDKVAKLSPVSTRRINIFDHLLEIRFPYNFSNNNKKNYMRCHKKPT